MLFVKGDDDNQLHVYTANGSHVTTTNISYDVVLDAVWAPHSENIVCTAWEPSLVLVMALSGDVIARTEDRYGRNLGVCADVVHFTSTWGDIFYSSGGGKMWRLLNTNQRSKNHHRAIKVLANNISYYDIWTLTEVYNETASTVLIIYTVNNNSMEDIKWRNVTLPDMVSVEYGRLAYDGCSSVWTTDWKNDAVHVWSVHGYYMYVRKLCALKSVHSVRPMGLAVDRERLVMYVGQTERIVNMFTLLYQ